MVDVESQRGTDVEDREWLAEIEETLVLADLHDHGVEAELVVRIGALAAPAEPEALILVERAIHGPEEGRLDFANRLFDEVSRVTGLTGERMTGRLVIAAARIEPAAAGMAFLSAVVTQSVDQAWNSGELLTRELHELPVPRFGSPPADWVKLGTILSGTTGVAAVATAHYAQGGVIALLWSGGVAVVWFTRPLARIARRSAAERFAARLNTKLEPSDLE